MRLFVAVEIGDQLVNQSEDLIRELKTRVAEHARGARVTWLTGNRLHVTVRFIGQVEVPRGTSIINALEPPINVSPFDLKLAGVGAFPDRGAPRVLWAGIEYGGESLLVLERVVSSRLAGLGLPREERPYRPHLTLARVREDAGLRTPRLLAGLDQRSIGVVRIDAITLFESRLGPGGPRYIPLVKTALMAGSAA